jgi:lambda repressor-like predicted transcriptional regulator
MSLLRDERQRQGLSLWALAVRAGCSPTTLTAIEVHGFAPRVETKERIADALGVGVDELWPELGVADASAEVR